MQFFYLGVTVLTGAVLDVVNEGEQPSESKYKNIFFCWYWSYFQNRDLLWERSGECISLTSLLHPHPYLTDKKFYSSRRPYISGFSLAIISGTRNIWQVVIQWCFVLFCCTFIPWKPNNKFTVGYSSFTTQSIIIHQSHIWCHPLAAKCLDIKRLLIQILYHSETPLCPTLNNTESFEN